MEYNGVDSMRESARRVGSSAIGDRHQVVGDAAWAAGLSWGEGVAEETFTE